MRTAIVAATRVVFDGIACKSRFAQMEHAVRLRRRDFRMRDEQRRGVVVASPIIDDCEDARCSFGIEIAGRLIEQEQGGSVDQRACDRDALQLATRKHGGKFIAATRESDRCEHRVRALVDRFARCALKNQR